MSYNLTEFELHNIFVNAETLVVREGLRTVIEADTVASGCNFVGNVSVKSRNTDEMIHYLFMRNSTTGEGTCYTTNEEYQIQGQVALGQVPEDLLITAAVQNYQILINGPNLPFPLYGIIGGALIRAEKVASVNPSTTAIDIPKGICCTFGGRIAIAQYNLVYFNDAGTEIRTFVAQNALALPSNIYDLFQGAGGGLYAVCADAIYVLPLSALTSGQLVSGNWSKISNNGILNHRNSCAVQNGLFVLTQDGAATVSDSFNSTELAIYGTNRYYTNYTQITPAGYHTGSLTRFAKKRYWSKSVGPGATQDYRNSAIFGLDNALLINVDGIVCWFDITIGRATWIYNSTEIEIVGLGKTRNGGDLWILPNRIIEMAGNVEFDGNEISGIACGNLALNTKESTVIREVITTANNTNQEQFVYIGNTAKTAITPVPRRANNIIGTSVWNTTETFVGNEDRSRRHLVAVRTDELALEVGITGSGARFGPVDLTVRGKGKNRPQELQE